jgi:hypothetical protein
MGDCLMDDVFDLFAAPFLVFFMASAEDDAIPDDSRSIRPGELVDADPCLLSYAATVSFWACRAGDVRGLKYAPGTVN